MCRLMTVETKQEGWTALELSDLEVSQGVRNGTTIWLIFEKIQFSRCGQ